MVDRVIRFKIIPAFAILVSLLVTGRAGAHPLGNFTINHLAVVTPGAGQLHVHYVLDIAEIPTFQIMHASGDWSPARRRQWETDEAVLVGAGLTFKSGSRTLPMALVKTNVTTRPGAGGLPTLYWTGDYTVPIEARASVAIHDAVYADRRIGWKDIILPGLTDPTNALRSYPSALIGSPRHNDSATFDVTTSGTIANARVSGDETTSWDPTSIVRSSALSDLFSQSNQTPLLVFLTVLAAFGLGALHGLEPGHGKALLAFTLVGARATFKQAVILAGALTFAHTIAVLLLGLLLFFVAGFATESIFTWITLVSGLAVAVIGARSLSIAVGRVAREREHVHAHAHGHDHHHHHHHDDDRERDHGHSHAIPGNAPLHFPSAVIAAMSGGIAPCPAAIVVLLTALHLHRVGYGLFLIVVFSLGLAAILTGLGLAVVHGAAWLQQRSGFARLAAIAPFVTASVISIIGSTMLAQALVEQGVRLPALAVIAMTLLAVALFALYPLLQSTRSTHRTLAIKETL
jgi:nickel/cobalt transporter (NicO) family protein